MKWFMCLLAVFVLWMLLFWGAWDGWVVGTGVGFACLVGTLLGAIFPDGMEKLFNPRRWLFAAIYLPYFLWCCLKANLDVALRVIHPDVPISPGIVKVRTSLQSEMARTFLANSITLTPGTLTIDIDGQDLYIHWINVALDDPEARSREICGRFEPLLRRIFE